MAHQIAILEGYGTPFGRHRRRRRRGGGGAHRAAFKAASRHCAKHHKPGTHAFGSCMRGQLKK